MTRFQRYLASLAILCGGSAYAADSPLSQISQEADVVIRIRQFDGTVEKLAALANAVQPGTGDLVSQNSAAFGLALSNPAMAGVDRSKDFYLFVFVREIGEPKALFAIPTTDGEALKKALPGNFEAEVRKDWVFYADKDHGVPEAASENDSLAKVLEGDSKVASIFSNSDIGLHVNIDHITTIYDDKLQQAHELIKAQLQQGLNAPGVSNPEAVVGVLRAEIELGFKVLEETDSLTLGFSPSAEQLQVDHLLQFSSGSDVAKFIARQPKSEFAGFSKLGAGLPIYLGFSGDFAELGDISMQLVGSMFDGTPLKEGMKGYQATMKKHGIHSAVTALELVGGDNGMLRSAILFETTHAGEMLAASRSFYETVKEMKIGEVTTKLSLAAESETIGSHKVDVVTTTQEVDPSSPGAQTVTMMNTILYGPNGIQTRLTSLADGMLMTQGGGQEAMEAALKSYDSSNGAPEVRSDLPKEAHLIAMFDLPGFITSGMLAATSIPGLPVPFQKSAIEDLQITRSYSLTAAVGDGDTMLITTRIPVQQIQGIMKLVMFVRSQR